MKFDLKFLSECFDINFLKGTVRWKNDRPEEHFSTTEGHISWKTRSSGKLINSINFQGYKALTVTHLGKRVTLLQHRIVYALFHNDPRPPHIDHFNRDRTDNSISNLRPSDHEVNARNRKISVKNTSGITGVQFRVNKSGYYFWITLSASDFGPRTKVFTDFFEACCERKSWELKNNYTEAHGKYD